MHSIIITGMDINILDHHDRTQYGNNMTPAVQSALREARHAIAPTLRFPSGEYHFWPEGSVAQEYAVHANGGRSVRQILFSLQDVRNLTIDGDGATLIMHGHLSPFILEHSTGVTIRKLRIDTARPFFTQGEIIDATTEYVDVRIDPVAFPHRVSKGQLVSVSDAFLTPIDGRRMVISFDPKTGGPAHNMPYCFSELRAESRKQGIVRLQGIFPAVFRTGDILIIDHGSRNDAGFVITESRNIIIEDVDIAQISGMGVVSQFSEDITLRRLRVMPDVTTGRLISSNADATHWVHCTGRITMEDCVFEGMLDDACNVHGVYTLIRDIHSPTQLEVELMRGDQVGHNLYRPGDRIALVDAGSLATQTTAVVKASRLMAHNRIMIDVVDPLCSSIGPGALIENPTRMPEVIIRNCRTGKNRPRGFLIATPRRVLIEGCTLYNSDSGIFIHGDLNWHESGPTTDVTIHGNTFQNCGYAVANSSIVICPSIATPVAPAAAYYHRNIRIDNNLFEHFEGHLVTAISVDGLSFRGNRFKRTSAYPARGLEQPLCMDHCANVAAEEPIILKPSVPRNRARQERLQQQTVLSPRAAF